MELAFKSTHAMAAPLNNGRLLAMEPFGHLESASRMLQIFKQTEIQLCFGIVTAVPIRSGIETGQNFSSQEPKNA